MLRNYLTLALRTLRKQPGYAFVNIFGLGLGLAASLLILLYVQDELSYDRHHPHADRIYQVGLDGKIGGQFVSIAQTASPMGPTLLEEVPEVEQAVRILANRRRLVSHGDRRFNEDRVFWADAAYFELFAHQFLSGDPRTALAEPYSVVLPVSTARKYFGEADPVGQTLTLNNRDDYTVTGVVEDLPSHSIIQFDVLGSFVTLVDDMDPGWLSHYLYTYLLLREGATPSDVQATFPALIDTYVAPEFEHMAGTSLEDALAAGMKWDYTLQPLTTVYLQPEGEDQIGPTSDIRYVYILGAVALFILLLACINFMNLSTARSAGRAREVGMRKVLGSDRRQLIQQFLGESTLMALSAAVLAVVLVVVLLPFFGTLAGKTLAFTPGNVLGLAGALVGIALVCGLVAGIYPAFVLSAFQPADVLKGALSSGARGRGFRSTLVVVQFAVSITLLIGTGVVLRQLQFMQNERLGFAGEQVVVLPLESDEAGERFDTFRQTLLRHPGVVEVAASDFVPGRVNSTNGFRPDGATAADAIVIAAARVSHDFASTLGLTFVAGRDFDRRLETDASAATVINEAAARELGWTPEEAVGRTLNEMGMGPDNSDIPREIIGVVADFHFESLHQRIRPLAMNIQPDWFSRIVVRVRSDDLPATLAFLEETWRAFEPEYPYRSVFLDADFRRFYEREQQLGRVFLAFTVLAIFIACLGLFGLASFLAQQRTKEIGVRKVMGASVSGIVVLLSKEFTGLVLVAAVVAAPVAYLAMNRWLEGFAYRVGIELWLIAAAAGIALVIAWLTVSYQAFRAATVDPVRALRYE